MHASDVGLITMGLFADPCVANRVCSPVKISEYLVSGLPVIMSSGLGDFSDEVIRHKLGVVLPHDASPRAISDLLAGFLGEYLADPDRMRQHCREYAVSTLDLEIALNKIRTVYSQLAAEMGQ
jgi:glycosyltransferase involved in cell wall biosynthesis